MSDPTDAPDDAIPPERRIFVNRTLNLRAIRAVGFDMDYTLVHYRVEVWERHAYERARERLAERGWPVKDLVFDPSFVILGLVLDLELGNLVKATRFGWVTRATHGTGAMDFERQRETYSRVLVDLREPRWVFLNTLFSLSEALLWAQCVDLLDQGRLEPGIGYAELYSIVRTAVDRTHTEGALKAQIARDPDRFVVLDPELPLALLDLKHSGKRLLLITNSEWSYTQAMMSYAFDRYLPGGKGWRALFDVVLVSARKPDFFTARSALFEVIDDSGLLRPCSETVRPGGAFLGGHAQLVERGLELRPEEILYFGDHLYADVHVTKDLLRWRTALVVRDLEREVLALDGFADANGQLAARMAEKELLERAHCRSRLSLQRTEHGYGPPPFEPPDEVRARIQALKARLSALDGEISPLAARAAALFHPRWGLMMRAGIDKSYLARQLERYADVYMSRVSNLLAYTPFVYLRAPHVSLPHDEGSIDPD